jgi:hypothetical protein
LDKALTGHHNKVGGSPDTHKFPDGYYAMKGELFWKSRPDEPSLPKFRVPIGFVTDFASIPQFFWDLLPRDGAYATPAILHDFMYWQQSWTKQQVDTLLKVGMGQFHVEGWKIAAIYWGVDKFGQHSWESNQKLKKSDEKRILKAFPEDPSTTWAQWKLRPDVSA